MSKMTPASKWAILIVIVVLIVVLGFYYGGQGGSSSPTSTATSTTETASSTATTTVATPATTVTPPASKPAPTPAETIRFISPVPNDTWVIGQSNAITWNEQAGVTGYLSLVDPTTGAEVGVILNQVGPHQTSYSWNSVSILLGRTNPSKKNVVPGVYEIKFTFDGNGLAPITTSPFTIAAPQQPAY